MLPSANASVGELLRKTGKHASERHSFAKKWSFGWDELLLVSAALTFLFSFAIGLYGKHLLSLQTSALGFLILYCLGTLLALAVPIRGLLVSLKDCLHPIPSLLRTRSPAMLHDHSFLRSISKSPKSDLTYLAGRLELEANHMRSRVGLLVGSIDKVGTLPLIAGSCISGWKFVHEAQIRPSLLEIGVAGFSTLYMIGMIFTLAAHRLDELAQLLRLAEQFHDPDPETLTA